jgi:CRISPR/Cas system CSM-associated protein Csm3 (group 7 of RAMP superfamily)
LLELKYGLRDIACCERKNEKISYHNITDNPQEVIARSFGCASNDIKITSRLLFSDFHLIQTDIIKKYISSTGKLSNDFYEDKAEVTIPRNMFDKPNPRHQERVPAGVSFEGNITLVEPNTLDFAISQKTLEEILEEGIALIQNTYL